LIDKIVLRAFVVVNNRDLPRMGRQAIVSTKSRRTQMEWQVGRPCIATNKIYVYTRLSPIWSLLHDVVAYESASYYMYNSILLSSWKSACHHEGLCWF
jgi:hypothetical protein